MVEKNKKNLKTMKQQILELILVLLFAYTQIGVDSKAHKISLIHFDEEEIAKITAYNRSRMKYGIRPIYYNAELMRIAQVEAHRLANMDELNPPEWNLPNKVYRGFSVRVKHKYGSYFGQKICFDNIKPFRRHYKMIDYNERCQNEHVDWRSEYAVGYGRALGDEEHVYGVKVYFINTKSKLKLFLCNLMQEI